MPIASAPATSAESAGKPRPLPRWVSPGAPAHPQGGQGEGAKEHDYSDDQQVQQAFGDYSDDAQRDGCDH
jgi:hypothetical protein